MAKLKPRVEVESKSLQKGVSKLIKQGVGVDVMLDDLEFLAMELIRRAIDSPIPRDTGMLANSDAISVDRGKKSITFGFNRSYAAFQDQPGKSGQVVVRPRIKKWLFIPLTQRARRTHRYGNNPENEGLVFGGFVQRVGGGGGGGGGGMGSADYILAKEAIIQIKPYGSALGPNHYFSETLRRNVNFVLEQLAERQERRLGNLFPKGG